MYSDDAFYDKELNLNYFYMHTNFGQKYLKTAIVMSPTQFFGQARKSRASVERKVDNKIIRWYTLLIKCPQILREKTSSKNVLSKSHMSLTALLFSDSSLVAGLILFWFKDSKQKIK